MIIETYPGAAPIDGSLPLYMDEFPEQMEPRFLLARTQFPQTAGSIVGAPLEYPAEDAPNWASFLSGGNLLTNPTLSGGCVYSNTTTGGVVGITVNGTEQHTMGRFRVGTLTGYCGLVIRMADSLNYIRAIIGVPSSSLVIAKIIAGTTSAIGAQVTLNDTLVTGDIFDMHLWIRGTSVKCSLQKVKAGVDPQTVSGDIPELTDGLSVGLVLNGNSGTTNSHRCLAFAAGVKPA